MSLRVDASRHRPVAAGLRRQHRQRHPPRRPRRTIRRAAAVFTALAVLGGAALGALLAATPAVGDAEARARVLAGEHHIQDAGLPVPGRFAAALVATEDSRFYGHHGLDTLGVLRAGLGTLRPGGPDAGGATLDQQLAKNLYPGGDSTTGNKVQQAGLALKLDHQYAKASILEMYAEVAYFGNGYYGLAASSCGYFGLPPARLDWAQSTLLAGLVQAPSAYDPVTHADLARSRQSAVLTRLVDTGALTNTDAAAIALTAWRLRPAGTAPGPGCP